jgi:glycerol uptake facilitator-like aquaporin
MTLTQSAHSPASGNAGAGATAGSPPSRGRAEGQRPIQSNLAQRAVAELLGTAFLLAGVIGSGIMAAKLSGGNGALALLCNTLPTGAILTVLILTFGPVSGAHFNPAVSMAFALRRELPWPEAAAYMVVQIIGGIVGVWAAHAMFEMPLWQISLTVRTGPGQWFAEFVATFGLVLTILGCLVRTPSAIPYAVGLYITAAYWFTASTSFANPAVTIARALSNTYAGIAPAGIAAFIAAQFVGALLAVALARWLFELPARVWKVD